jgi:hypothetical protein
MVLMEPQGNNWAAITDSLNRMQDLIETASLYQRKLARAADSVTRQRTAYDQLDRVIKTLNE